ncbi:MAG: DUF2510 domain-containing protein [Acidimicrobiia bacterium]
MNEFISIKVAAFDHDALATALTTRSAEGWSVEGIVAVGTDVIAYLSRPTTKKPTAVTAPTTTTIVEPAGWASNDPTPAGLAETVVVPTAEATTPSVPANWYKDPTGRFDYRYWDGKKWTDHVSRAGKVSKDPPTP